MLFLFNKLRSGWWARLCHFTVYNCVNSKIKIKRVFIVNNSDCAPLDWPEHGSISYTGYTPDSTATYQCNTNYVLVGDVTRTCQETSSWSGSAARCIEGMFNCVPKFDSPTLWGHIGLPVFVCPSAPVFVRPSVRLCQAQLRKQKSARFLKRFMISCWHMNLRMSIFYHAQV